MRERGDCGGDGDLGGGEVLGGASTGGSSRAVVVVGGGEGGAWIWGDWAAVGRQSSVEPVVLPAHHTERTDVRRHWAGQCRMGSSGQRAQSTEGNVTYAWAEDPLLLLCQHHWQQRLARPSAWSGALCCRPGGHEAAIAAGSSTRTPCAVSICSNRTALLQCTTVYRIARWSLRTGRLGVTLGAPPPRARLLEDALSVSSLLLDGGCDRRGVSSQSSAQQQQYQQQQLQPTAPGQRSGSEVNSCETDSSSGGICSRSRSPVAIIQRQSPFQAALHDRPSFSHDLQEQRTSLLAGEPISTQHCTVTASLPCITLQPAQMPHPASCSPP